MTGLKISLSKVPEADRTSAIFQHDMINIVTLTIVVIYTSIYLISHTTIENIGTKKLIAPQGHEDFKFLYYLFAFYIVFDSVYIYLIPHSVAAKSPWLIIIHHLVTIGLMTFPLFDQRYEWHMAITLTVETNTIFLTCRRNTTKGSLLNQLFELAFYATWFLFRLMLFPFLTILFCYEWYFKALATGNYFNYIIVSPVLMAGLTAMSLQWTYELITKNLMGREGQPDRGARQD